MVTDSELLQASLAGDRRAYGLIVERYESLVCALAYSATGDIGLSEDIAQDTFVAAWSRLAEIRDLNRFRAWLCGIVRNLSMLSLRKRKRDATARGIVLRAVSGHDATFATPRDQAIQNEEQALLWKTIEGIPDGYRVPLILFYREGRSVQGVADTLGLSANTVKQRLFRGRQMVRDELADFVEDALKKTRPKTGFAPAVLAVLPTAQGIGVGLAARAAGRLIVKSVPRSVPQIVGAVAGVALVVGGGAIFLLTGTDVTASIQEANPSQASQVMEAPPRIDEQRERHVLSESTQQLAQLDESVETEVAADEPKETIVADAARQRQLGIDLAKAELEKGWQSKSMPAADMICIKGWAYLTMLGDEDGRTRLLDIVRELHTERLYVNQQMLMCLHDATAQNYLSRLASDAGMPISQRVRAFEGLMSPPIAPEARVVPAAIEDYYRERMIESGFTQDSVRQFTAAATESSRLFLEDLLSICAFDGTSRTVPSRGGAFRAATSVAPQQTASYGCIAHEAVGALERIANPASVDLLRAVALESSVSGLQGHAIMALSALGDESFAQGLLYERVTREPDVAERMACAYQLASAGDTSYTYIIRDAMSDTDTDVRTRAYSTLCRLGDPAFIGPASSDNKSIDGEPLGFWQIRHADERRLEGSSLQWEPGSMSDLLCEYIYRVASEASNPKAEEAGLTGLSTGTDEQARRALPLARLVLRQRPVKVPADRLPDKAVWSAWRIQLCRLVILLRTASPESQEQAIERVEAMYDQAGEEPKGSLITQIGWARNPGLAPLFSRVIEECPRPNVRLTAAAYLLAAEAGVLPR